MAEFQTPVKVNKVVAENDKITIPPSPFMNRLGYGTGVSVMQLVRSPEAGQMRSPWALKMLNKRVKSNIVYTERLQAEADLLKRMSHPNIVGFRAFDKTRILYLGMEACDLSLGDMVEKKYEDGCEPFAVKYILKVASDIGNALEYLHTNMRILHGDIKSYNILVNGDFAICKLCDFGVTLPLDENGQLDKEKAGESEYCGTKSWTAPEVILGCTITSKSDIWSLGMVFWEMLALMPPYLHLEDSLDSCIDTLDDEQSMNNYCHETYGYRPAVPANLNYVEYEKPLTLFCNCTLSVPEMRPTAHEVVLTATSTMPSHEEDLQT